MDSDERLYSLLSVWHQARVDGREMRIEELCRDAPELIPIVAEGIAALDRLNGLVAVASGEAAALVLTKQNDDHPVTFEAPSGFTIETELGRGGMGVVYRARQTKLNRIVALKLMLAGGHARPGELFRFLAEAEAVAAIDHKHVVRVHEFGECGGLPYMALEFLNGGNLAGLLRREEKLTPRRAAELMVKIASGVQAAHDLGIVHRDLKPQNVLFDAAGEPKVADFGLAKRGGGADLTMSDTVLGTPVYMSPEQAKGQTKFAGPSADVYALGVILYECITGTVPFRGEDTWSVIRQVIHEEPEPPRKCAPSVPCDLEVICLKCLAKNPRQRYSTADALASDLCAFLAGRPIAARPVGLAERAWKWARRHPGRASIAAAGLFVAVGLGMGAKEVRRLRETDRLAAEQDFVQKQKNLRTESLVQTLMTAETTEVPRVLDDLSGVYDLAEPRLLELSASPVSVKSGLHARLALLGTGLDRAKELADYLPDCRSNELLVICQLLKPHAPVAAPRLWSILADDRQGQPRRVRAACALSRLTPVDPRWSAVGPAVARMVTRENPLEATVWATSLDPVENHLVPSLLAVYAESRQLINIGKLDASAMAAEVSALDLAANFLARYAANKPEVLAELAISSEARHHSLFERHLVENRAILLPILHAELAKELIPSWKDPLLNSAWEPIDNQVFEVVKSAHGLIHERFAFVVSLPLASIEPLTTRLGSSGYRPCRVRPYSTPDGVHVAAVWQRDGGEWRLSVRTTADEFRAKDDEYRASGFQPIDAAGWQDSEGGAGQAERTGVNTRAEATDKGSSLHPLRFTVVWARSSDGKPRNQTILGVPANRHRDESASPKSAGLGPLTIQSVSVADESQFLCEIWGEAPSSWNLAWVKPENLRTSSSGRVLVDVTAAQGSSKDTRYAAVWHGGMDVEVDRPTALTLDEHLTYAQGLAADGWRIRGITAVAVQRKDADSSGVKVSSVWHRPTLADATLVDLASRRANAAAALLMLGESARVWLLLRHSPDPTLRSFLIRRLAGVGLSPLTIIDRFGNEQDVSLQRALLITLGEFPPDTMPVADREAFAVRLLHLYQVHPDPGLHSAIDWLLKQRWGKEKEIKTADAELAIKTKITSRLDRAGIPIPAITAREWFVNCEGQTYSVVRGPIEFNLGSQTNEPGRTDDEQPHRKRFGRSFAIMTKEVSIEQFLRFRPTFSWPKRHSPGPDTPVIAVRWYDAAAYCNWLSEREGISPDQWCYEPNAENKYAAGMRIRQDHLSLSGYRLPTEAEWEYATRSGSVVARFYGRGEGLLSRYAWYLGNGLDLCWPVGQLRPNDFGLFDALGNAAELIATPLLPYGELFDLDRGNLVAVRVDDQLQTTVRGGTSGQQPANVRSSYRNDFCTVSSTFFMMGFRPARTVPHLGIDADH